MHNQINTWIHTNDTTLDIKRVKIAGVQQNHVHFAFSD